MSELIKREDAINAVEMFFKDAYIEDADVHCADMVYEINHIPTASPWHRVEEPPKEEHRTYLVYTDTGYMCSCRWTNNVYGLGASDRWGWCLADIPQFQEVVYWMPIEPPKEDA